MSIKISSAMKYPQPPHMYWDWEQGKRVTCWSVILVCVYEKV